MKDYYFHINYYVGKVNMVANALSINLFGDMVHLISSQKHSLSDLS